MPVTIIQATVSTKVIAPNTGVIPRYGVAPLLMDNHYRGTTLEIQEIRQ